MITKEQHQLTSPIQQTLQISQTLHRMNSSSGVSGNKFQYMENWKREVLRDKIMNKMLGKSYNQKGFVIDLVKNHTINEIQEIYQNMNSVKQHLVSSLDSTLQKNYVELINDMERLKNVDVNIEECRDQMQVVNTQVQSIFGEFTSKYELLQKKIPYLKNSYQAIQLIQSSLKFVQNFKLLKSLVGFKFEVVDFVKTSQILNELTQLCKQVDFSGLTFFEQSKDFIKQAREATIQKTDKKFDEALASKNQVEISNSIQIFYNLGILAETLQAKANQQLKNTKLKWKNVFTKEYQQSKIIGQMNFEIKALTKEMLSNSLQIWLLNQSIKTSRDPKSLESYEEFLKGKNLLNLFDLFWNKQIHILQQSLALFQDNNKKYENNWKCFVINYPKVFSFLEEFVNTFHELVIQFPDHLHSYNVKELKEKVLDTFEGIRALYFKQLNETIKKNSQGLLAAMATYSNNSKVYSQKVNSSLQMYLQKTEFELIENVQNEQLFASTTKIILENISDMSNTIENQFQQNPDGFPAVILVVISQVFSVLKQNIISNICNSDKNFMVDQVLVQQTLETLSPFLINKINPKLRFKLFQEVDQKIMSNLLFQKEQQQQQQQHQQQQQFQRDIFVALDNLLKLYSPNLIQYDNDCHSFNRDLWIEWENYILDIINKYAIISLLQVENQKKSQETVANEIEFLTNLIDNNALKQSQTMQSLVNIHKLFILDYVSADQMLERDVVFKKQKFMVLYSQTLKLATMQGKENPFISIKSEEEINKLKVQEQQIGDLFQKFFNFPQNETISNSQEQNNNGTDYIQDRETTESFVLSKIIQYLKSLNNMEKNDLFQFLMKWIQKE